VNTYKLVVPAGTSALDVGFHTADASPDNKFTFYLIDPSGAVVNQRVVWFGPDIQPGGHSGFEVTVTERAASYRVSVFSVDLIKRSGP